MKFIKSSADLIKEDNPFKLIERVGRTCYKSEDKITDTSCYDFVRSLIDRKHFAMLEHGRVYAVYGPLTYEKYHEMLAQISKAFINVPQVYISSSIEFEQDNGYIILDVSMSHIFNPKWELYDCADILKMIRDVVIDKYKFSYPYASVSIFRKEIYNAPEYCIDDRVYSSEEELLNNLDIQKDDFSRLYKAFDTDEHVWRTIKFTCDRGVSHELVRHRVALAQESTRYCNYTKSKFGSGNISFVYPSSWDEWSEDIKSEFTKGLEYSERIYNLMIEAGHSPQEARAILPNALKTEVVVTANLGQWKHFFDMRYFGETGKPHPDMELVAGYAYENILKEDLRKQTIADFK